MKYLGQPTKAELWDNVTTIPRVDRYPVDRNFIWLTMDGRLMKAQEMQTTHLWNSLKMIWNHRVNVAYRIIPYKPYPGIEKWDTERTRFAVRNLFNELMNRQDRSQFMNECLQKMAEYMRAWANEKIQNTPRHKATPRLPEKTQG